MNPDVYTVKAETVRKNGLLEVVNSDITLEKIGGLKSLKADLPRLAAATDGFSGRQIEQV
ncbi:MAG: hypothetical protein JXQ71_05985 [Verrucomicrobia bacterium]|nr:hypothetical protein [Verrucomicrobiota bacterium]